LEEKRELKAASLEVVAIVALHVGVVLAKIALL
jgi:chromosome segregation and condensation protein ScpB